MSKINEKNYAGKKRFASKERAMDHAKSMEDQGYLTKYSKGSEDFRSSDSNYPHIITHYFRDKDHLNQFRRQRYAERKKLKEETQMTDFKKGETVYLKTKKFNNTPHTGKVVKVTDSHVHISSAGGTYKAPKNIVTREYKDSHLYKSVREEAQLDELSTDTLKSYVKKASDVAKSNYRWKGGFIVNKIPSHKAKNRKQGVLNATDRIMQREEVAVNAAGAGNVAGLGIGPQGEPGVKKKKKNIMTFSRFMRK